MIYPSASTVIDMSSSYSDTGICSTVTGNTKYDKLTGYRLVYSVSFKFISLYHVTCNSKIWFVFGKFKELGICCFALCHSM